MSSRADFSCAGSDAVAAADAAMHLTTIALCNHHRRTHESTTAAISI
jgi:hypothetical protein